MLSCSAVGGSVLKVIRLRILVSNPKSQTLSLKPEILSPKPSVRRSKSEPPCQRSWIPTCTRPSHGCTTGFCREASKMLLYRPEYLRQLFRTGVRYYIRRHYQKPKSPILKIRVPSLFQGLRSCIILYTGRLSQGQTLVCWFCKVQQVLQHPLFRLLPTSRLLLPKP